MIFLPPVVPETYERVTEWRLSDGYVWADVVRIERTGREFRRWSVGTRLDGNLIAANKEAPAAWTGAWDSQRRTETPVSVDGPVDWHIAELERRGKDGQSTARLGLPEGRWLDAKALLKNGSVVSLTLTGARIAVPGGTELASVTISQRMLLKSETKR